MELEEECTFETTADMVQLTTKTNGDKIIVQNLHLTQAEATSLAWLVNADGAAVLEFSIKLKEV